MFNNQNKPGFTAFGNNPQQPQNTTFTGAIGQPPANNLFANKPATGGTGMFNNPTQNTPQQGGGFLVNTNQPQQTGFFNQNQQQPQQQGGFLNRGANTPQTGFFNQPTNTNPTPVGGTGFFNQPNQPTMFGQNTNTPFNTQTNTNTPFNTQPQTFNTPTQPQGFNPQIQTQPTGMMPNTFTQQPTNMFQVGGFNQPTQTAGQNLNPEQQKQVPEVFSCDYVKQAISHYRKLI